MAGYNQVLKIRRLEQALDQLGFVMTDASNYYRSFGDVVAIRPKDEDSLPVYSRDAEVFVGTIEDLEQWLKGVEWARTYDGMLFGRRHNTNRKRREQNFRNEQLVKLLSKTEADNDTRK